MTIPRFYDFMYFSPESYICGYEKSHIQQVPHKLPLTPRGHYVSVNLRLLCPMGMTCKSFIHSLVMTSSIIFKNMR